MSRTKIGKNKKLDIIQARHNAGYTVKTAAKNLGITPSVLRLYERRLRPFSELNDGFKSFWAYTYGYNKEDIEWRDYQYADVTIAAFYLGVDVRTMRSYLKDGKFGYATKEDGETNYKYHVNFDLIEKIDDLKSFRSGIAKGKYGRYDSNAEPK